MKKLKMGWVLAVVTALAFSASVQAQGTPSRVWIQFQPGQKAAVQSALRQVGANVHYEFDQLNAIAATVPEQALNGISRNPNVTLVEEDPIRELFSQTVPYGIDMVQARDVWDVDRDNALDAGAPTGSPMRIGVIDSGVLSLHEDFVGATVRGEASGTGSWNYDGIGHGTHVVGTILATQNELGVIGVAPGASVYMVKVFNDSGVWTYSSSLVYAVDRAVANGARIISMSLGGSRKSVTEQRAFDSHYRQGILLVAAAGNAGTSAFSYPASYSSVISVGAIDASKSWAPFSQYNSQVELAAPGVGVLSTVPSCSVEVDSVSYTANQVEYSKVGTAQGNLVNGGLATAQNKEGWSGKVVLVERGEISFYEKVINVQLSGGVAAVIYNNEPGGFLGTLGDGNSSTIPAISISQEDGGYLVANKLEKPASVSTLLSSSAYAYYDGTSMATPHVSAVAALLWGAFPTLSNDEIRIAMQSTALDLGAAGRDNYFGYGLVQAKDAYGALSGTGGGGDTGGDPTPLAISGVTDTKQNVRKFKISWTTNVPATSKVVFSDGASSSDTAMVTSHSMTFSGTPGTTYQYYVESTDAANNTARDPAAGSWYYYAH